MYIGRGRRHKRWRKEMTETLTTPTLWSKSTGSIKFVPSTTKVTWGRRQKKAKEIHRISVEKELPSTCVFLQHIYAFISAQNESYTAWSVVLCLAKPYESGLWRRGGVVESELWRRSHGGQNCGVQVMELESWSPCHGIRVLESKLLGRRREVQVMGSES